MAGAFGFRRLLTFCPIAYGPSEAMLPKTPEDDRRRAGWSMGQAAWDLGVSIREYRELEAGEREPNWEMWERICKLYGWPQTFVGASVNPQPATD